MNLRTRLIAGYSYLTLLSLTAAVGGALGFHQLARAIDAVLEENYESIQAGTAMDSALERQDSACLEILLGRVEARELMTRSEDAFREGLARARRNVTVDDAIPLLQQIDDGFESYVVARDRLLESRPEDPLIAYEDETMPRLIEIKTALAALLDVHHSAMLQADRENQARARQGSIALALLATVALLSLGYLTRNLRTTVLDRLGEIGDVAAAAFVGRRMRRVRVTQDDELGRIGQQLNRALDTLEETRGAAEGRLQQQRRLVLAVLDSLGEPVALVGLDGLTLESTLEEDRLIELERFTGESGNLSWPEVDDVPGTMVLDLADGTPVRCQPLLAGGVQPIGWLVRCGVNR